MSKRGHKIIANIVGVLIGIAAIYVVLRGINASEIKDALSKMNVFCIAPLILVNFCIIYFKSWRWQILLKPIKHIDLQLIFNFLLVSYMLNNVLPVKVGEVARFHMTGKEMQISRYTTAASMVADKIFEGLSFLLLAALLLFFENVPNWMHNGLTVTITITLVGFVLAIIYSKRDYKNHILIKLQEGVKPLLQGDVFIKGLALSLLSWVLQILMVYLCQIAFAVYLPVWGTLLVIIAINLVAVIPSAPGNLGTFELACVMAYIFLGVEKELALLIGLTYHMVQFIPVTLTGGVLILSKRSLRTLI